MTVSFNPLKANGQLFTHLPQLCKLATHVPSGPLWVHEIKFDGYRMATRTTPGKVQLLTRSGLDWTAKYPATAAALTKLPVQSAYLDGELCAVRPNGISDFGLMQQASDRAGEPIAAMPLAERKSRLAALIELAAPGSGFSSHEACDGEAFRRAACRYAPGKPKPGEIGVDIDRKNRILGNPFILRDATDKAARADVIERFRAKYHADLACDGPVAAATQALAERVKIGERIVCICWCWPKPCHGNLIIDEIKRRLE